MEDLGLGNEEQPKARGGGLFLMLLLGLTLGVAGTILLPRYLGDSLPMLRGGSETIQGPVLGKRSEEDRLLLTVQAEQGAVLATFRERIAEIDLLVDVGDTVSLGVARYEPFVEDPDFLGIRKAVGEPSSKPAAAEPPDSGEAAVEGDGEAGAVERESAERDTAALSLPGRDAEDAPGDTLD